MQTHATVRQAQQAAVAPNMNNGYIRGYSGTKPVGGPATALAGNTLLFTARFAATAFSNAATPTNGILLANAIAAVVAAASGTLSFVRLFRSDGTTADYDLTVGVGTGDCQLPTLEIAAGVTVNISALQLELPLGT